MTRWWWICARCGGPQEITMHEVTAFNDLVPRYIAGAPLPCEACGSLATPIRVQRAHCLTPVAYGPPVPTPDDLLRGAGLL